MSGLLAIDTLIPIIDALATTSLSILGEMSIKRSMEYVVEKIKTGSYEPYPVALIQTVDFSYLSALERICTETRKECKEDTADSSADRKRNVKWIDKELIFIRDEEKKIGTIANNYAELNITKGIRGKDKNEVFMMIGVNDIDDISNLDDKNAEKKLIMEFSDRLVKIARNINQDRGEETIPIRYGDNLDKNLFNYVISIFNERLIKNPELGDQLINHLQVDILREIGDVRIEIGTQLTIGLDEVVRNIKEMNETTEKNSKQIDDKLKILIKGQESIIRNITTTSEKLQNYVNSRSADERGALLSKGLGIFDNEGSESESGNRSHSPVNVDNTFDKSKIFFERKDVKFDDATKTAKAFGDASEPKKWYEPYLTTQRKDKQYLGKGFIGREWLFDEIKSWVEAPSSCVLILEAEMGVGKSAIAAQLSDYINVKAIQYCDRADYESQNPKTMMKVLIPNVASEEPAYRRALEIISDEPNYINQSSISILQNYITTPLEACQDELVSEKPWVMIVDGLDEAGSSMAHNADPIQSKDISMIDFLIASVRLWPKWFRLIVTTRPDSGILTRFESPMFTKMSIVTNSESNRDDVSRYIRTRNRMEELNIDPESEKRIEDLSDGNFHYAFTVINSIKTKNLSLANLGTLPPGFSGLYSTIFNNCFPDEEKYANEVGPLIACLAVTQLPVPMKIVVKASGLNQQTAFRGLRKLSQFLRRDGDQYRFSHQSWNQWLLDEDPMKNPFKVSYEDGYCGLVEAGLQELKSETGIISEYTLATLPYYLARLSRTDDLLEILQNPRYIEAICRKNRDEFMAIWSFVERTTALRMQTAYAPVLESPSKFNTSILENVSIMLFDTGYYDNAMMLLRVYEDICRNNNHLDGLQKSLYYQGEIERRRNNFEEAMALFREQENICVGNRLMDGLQFSLGRQGYIHHLKGNPDEASKLLDQQESICKKIGSYEGLQSNLAVRGIILSDRGKPDDALKMFNKQEDSCREHQSIKSLQNVLGNQGLILSRLSKYTEAIAKYNERAKICREHGFKRDLQECLDAQSYFLHREGDLKQVIASLEEERGISKELNDENNEMLSLYMIGDFYVKISNNHAARDAYSTVLSYFTSINHNGGMAACNYSLADLHIREGNFKAANDALIKARSLFIKEGDHAGEAECDYIIRNLDMLPLGSKDRPITGVTFVTLDSTATQEFLACIARDAVPVKFSDGNTIVQCANLSFYDEYKIYAISDTTFPIRNPRYALYRPDDLILLNWTNEPLYNLNERAPIKLNLNTYADYIRLFFYGVRGKLGRFIIVEKPEDVVWLENANDEEKEKVNRLLMPITYNGIGNDKFVSLTATVVFKNALFKTDIKIAPTEMETFDPKTNRMEHYSIGQISLTNEELLLENLNIFNEYRSDEPESTADGVIRIDESHEGSYSSSWSDDFPMNDFAVQSIDPTTSQNILVDMSIKYKEILINNSKSIIKCSHLPFYEALQLYTITDTVRMEPNTYYALYKKGDVELLDWTNQPIYRVNEREKMNFNPSACISYVRFFFHYVRGKFGQIVMVEKPEEIIWLDGATDAEKNEVAQRLMPITYNGIDHDNFITLNATFLFKGSLYKTLIKIAPFPIDRINPETQMQEHFSIGEIRLTDEHLLLENLSVPIH